VRNSIEQNTALYCHKLSKEFFVIGDDLNWRIVFRDLNRHLDSFFALKDIDLIVPKGKFVGILGRNGAGKSTLLRVLGGVYPATQGVVKANGQISGLFEMGGFSNPAITGHAYANRYLEIYGVKKTDRVQLINQIKAFSELENDFNKPIYTYSSGMASRLFFSTATELQHEIYLVDELLSVGDEHFQAKCWKRLRDRFSKGSSGILVTHDWSAVLKLCEQAHVLHKGCIIASGGSENIVQQYLNLPVPSKEYGEIITTSDTYVFESGKDSDINFKILQKIPTPLAVSYSIELFRAGYGWEMILLHPDFVKIQTVVGMNSCTIKIKKFPLVQGEYYLNIFLKTLDPEVDNTKIESRSWTYGNGVKIKVIGPKTDAVASLPWKIKMDVKPHASA